MISGYAFHRFCKFSLCDRYPMMTKFEEIKDGYYQADELMNDGIASINLLFPEIEIEDLNTGDY